MSASLGRPLRFIPRKGSQTGAGGMLAGVVECPARGGAAEGSRCVSRSQPSLLRILLYHIITKSRMYGPFLCPCQSYLTSKPHPTLPLLGLPDHHSFSEGQALCPDLPLPLPLPPLPASTNGAGVPGKFVG